MVPENYLALASLAAQDAETREFLLLHQGPGPLAASHCTPKDPHVHSDGSVAWTPSEMQRPAAATADPATAAGEEVARGEPFVLLFDFEAENPSELSVTKAQCVWRVAGADVREDDPGWLFVVDEQGRKGLVPETYVQPWTGS
jgi:hypothetical protein